MKIKYVLQVLILLLTVQLDAKTNVLKQSKSFESQKKSSTSISVEKSLFDDLGQNKVSEARVLRPAKSVSVLKSQNEDYNQLAKIIDQQIRELVSLTKKAKTKTSKAELWLRLAELYVEKADLTKSIIDQKYDLAIKAASENPKIKTPLLDYSPSQVYNKKAVDLYELFLQNSPKDKRVDQALFFLGYNYFEMGKTEKGQKYYQELTRRFPKSPFIIESRFALGEYFFENDKFSPATDHYLFVAKSKNKRLAIFARYKLAWCYFKQSQTEKGIKYLENIIKIARNSKESVALKLDSEAKRDLVVFYSEVGTAEKAPTYFEELFGQQESISYLEKLAYLYSDRGDRNSAKYAFNYLIRSEPLKFKSFDYKYQIVKSYSNAKDINIFKAEMYDWIKNFGPRSAWYSHNKNTSEEVKKSILLLEKTLRTWVLQQHQTAQNSRGEFSQKMAYDGYRLYFSEFPENKMTPELRFYFGELLYDMGKFDEASKEYRWVVENGKDSKFRSGAAANLLISIEKSLPTDEQIGQKVGDGTESVIMDPIVQNYIAQGEWYLKNFPNDKKAAEVKFRIGRLYYQYNNFDKAIPYFKNVVTQHSDTKYAEYSANLLLDIFNLKKDYEGLAKYGQELLAIPAVANSSIGKEIKDVLLKSEFKKAQNLDSQNDAIKSAQTYESFARKNQKTDLASMAFFNAAVNYNKGGNSSKSIEMIEILHDRPDAKSIELKKQTMMLLPTLYRDSGKLEKASQSYIQAVGVAKDDKEKANIYYNAAVLQEALDHKDKAIQNYLNYYQLSRTSDRSEVIFNVASLLREKNSRSKAIEYYQKYLDETPDTTEKSVEAMYWLYVLNKGRPADVDKWANRCTSLVRKLPEDQKKSVAHFGAKIELDRAKLIYQDLWSIKFDNVNQLKSKSDQKISLLEKLNNKVGEILTYNSPEEILDGVKLVGDANLNLYESLVKAPVPSELKKPEDIAKYQQGVLEIATPFVKKAGEAYLLVLQRSSEFETYTPAVNSARELLVKMDPQAVPYEKGQLGIEYHRVDWMGLSL